MQASSVCGSAFCQRMSTESAIAACNAYACYYGILTYTPPTPPSTCSAVYDTPSIQEDPAKWQDVLKKICWCVPEAAQLLICMICLQSGTLLACDC